MSAPHAASQHPRGLWTLPNAITMGRIVLIVVFGVLLVREQDGWAIAALAAAGASDFLDGYLARRLGQTSEWGRILDPAADRLLTIVVVLGLAWRDVIPWWLVALLLARDAVVGAVLLWGRRRTRETPQVTFAGKSATFGLYVFLPLAFLADGRWEVVHQVAIGGAAVAAAIYWYSAGQYAGQMRALAGSADRSAP